jgi:hypothetical protein
MKSGYYYGTEIDEKWWKRYKQSTFFMRGNGEYWLDDKGVYFRRFTTQEPLMIPFKKIKNVKYGRFHAGRVGLGKTATKIIWKNNGVLLSSGFNFGRTPENERLVQNLKKYINLER